ncbi:hypothetical protein B0H12DRAFT_1225043 [Mycena haematopus]|nr:hypothetical protein B0H12DRAFT_1225043 [Mycena haematopus]
MAPVQSTMAHPQSVPDPVICRRKFCGACHSLMGEIRPYTGLHDPAKVASRGRICQTCSSRDCHWTTFHTTVAYIMEDAEALCERVICRERGLEIPADKLVPLRLATATVAPTATGTGVNCATPTCRTAKGNRTRGCLTCIDFKCKTCCNNAALDARASNVARSSCPTHHSPAVMGLQPGAAAAPAPAIAPGNDLPPQPPHAPPAFQAQAPQPAAAQPAAAATTPHGARPAMQPHRILANPLGPLWLNARAGSVQEDNMRQDLKAQQLAMDERQKRTIELVIYHAIKLNPLVLDQYIATFPNLQLSSLPDIVNGLKLTEATRLDYWNGSWKIIDIHTVLSVEKGRSTLLKLRPSLLEELSLDDCPGLAERLLRQPRIVGLKRAGQPLDVVSPVKKAAKTSESHLAAAAAVAAVAVAPSPVVVDNNTALPPPGAVAEFLLPPPTATTSSAVPPAQRPTQKAKSAKRVQREWILDCPLSVWADGWVQISRIMDSDKLATQASAFPLVFGHPYVKATVIKYKNKFKNLSSAIRDRYIAMGNIPSASFQHAMNAIDIPPESVDSDSEDNVLTTVSTIDSHTTSLNVDPGNGEFAPAPGVNPALLNFNIPTTSHPPSTPTRIPPGSQSLDQPGLHLSTPSCRPPLSTRQLNTPLRSPATPQSRGVWYMDQGLDLDIYNAMQLSSQPSVSTAELGLCPFCDEPYIAAPSPKLCQMLVDAELCSEPSPTPANPHHRITNSFLVDARYCQQHREEGPILALARAQQWPEELSYDTLHRDILIFKPELDGLLEDLEESVFFSEARARLSSSALFTHFTGYFGEQGYKVISSAVREAFPVSAATDTEIYAPLTWEILVEQVLIPEAQCMLIAAQLEISPDDAPQVLRDSSEFGRICHSFDQQHTPLSGDRPPNKPAAAFPVPSPLFNLPSLPPLSPFHLSEEEDEGDNVDSTTLSLCSFCDQPLPDTPSAKLVSMRAELEAKSKPDPQPDNPGHREISMMDSIGYCELHRVERDIFPEAIARNWPFSPNFDTLFSRAMALRRSLAAICAEPEDSSFFRTSRDFYTPKPIGESGQVMSSAQLQSAMYQYQSSARFHALGAGYYGEIGYAILSVALRFMFPDGFDLSPFKPLTYDNLIREVLIPEAAKSIVQDDLGLTPLAAKTALRDSHVFGEVMHPSCLESPALEDAIRKTTKIQQRANVKYRLWVSADTNLGFDEWLEGQRVKWEPTEVLLAWPDEGPGPGLPVVRRGADKAPITIDLTLDSDDE